MMPTRSEHIIIRLDLDKLAYDRHKRDVDSLVTLPSLLYQGDTLRVSYDFHAVYFGEVEEKLKAVNRLLDDPAIIREADINELRHGHSIIVGVVEKLTRIIDQLEQKTDERNRKGWKERLQGFLQGPRNRSVG